MNILKPSWPWTEESKHAVLFFCLLLAALALLAQTALRPFLAFQNSLNEKIDSRRIQLARYQRLLSQKHDAENAIRRLQDFPHDRANENPARFLKDVESLARASSLRIRGMKPLPVEEKESHRKYAVQLESDASMEKLAAFLHGLGNPRSGLHLQKLDVSAVGEGAELNARLTLARFVFLRTKP